MTKKTTRRLVNKNCLLNILLLIILPLFLISCATTGPNKWDFNLISVSQEAEIGHEFQQEVEKQYPILNNSKAGAHVDKVGSRLLQGASEVHFRYTFNVIDQDAINAFALPGGHIYVYRGLIEAAENESELAAVMAHEINHVVCRHGTEQLSKVYGYNFLLSLAFGRNPPAAARIVGNLFGEMGMLAYGRKNEFEADRRAVYTMYKAGYDPHGMVSFFNKLKAMENEEPSRLQLLFSTHPPTSDRIEQVKREIATLPPKA